MQPVEHKPGEMPPKKKGKKAVRWDKDPDILFRLDTVAAMMLEGAKPYQIAASMHYDWNTAKRDMQRVEELWRRQIGKSIADKRSEAVAQWRHVLMHAWAQFRSSKNVVWLRVVTEAQANIDLIEGTRAPKEISVGISLSPEAEKALAALEEKGIRPEDLYSEFEKFIIEAAAGYKK